MIARNRWVELPRKWRKIILLSSTLLIYLLAYKYNFKNTMSLMSNVTKMEKTLTAYPLNMRTDDIEGLTKMNQLPTYNYKDFLKSVADYKNEGNIYIREISQYANSDQGNINIETNKMQVEGKYSDIVSFLYYLEYIKKTALISSVTIEIIYNKALEKYNLLATLYIKNIRYENENK